METEAPHSIDTAVFYLRGLDLLNGSPVTAEMRAEADKRYQQGSLYSDTQYHTCYNS